MLDFPQTLMRIAIKRSFLIPMAMALGALVSRHQELQFWCDHFVLNLHCLIVQLRPCALHSRVF